jgi:HK97 family phage portal protein
MIGHLERSTNNNIEHQAIEYVQYCLMPWAIMMEQAFDSRVFRVSEKESGQYYTKLELNALMRGDVTARKEFYRMMLDRGVFSINEVRRFEDMNDTAGGDIRLVQANMIPLNLIENQYKDTENGDS